MTRRILYVPQSSPWPPSGGGSQRTNLLYRALAECGDVDMLIVGPDFIRKEHRAVLTERFGYLDHTTKPRIPATWPWNWMQRLSYWRTRKLAIRYASTEFNYRPHSDLVNWLAPHLDSGRYDLLVMRYIATAAMTGATRFSPLIVDVDDLDYRFFESVNEAKDDARRAKAYSRRIAIARQNVPRILQNCEHVWLSNPEDAEHLDHPHMSVLPNIPFTTPEAEQAPAPSSASGQSRTVLMVGNLKVSANIDAALTFVNESWPLIHRAMPDAQLRLVGGFDPDGLLPPLNDRPGVELLGFVDDLDAEYRAAAFTVAPIRYGAGTKIKVLESLAKGRTTVVTPHAHEGFTHVLKDGESLRVADTSQRLAEACVELLEDPAKRDRLAARGQQLVLDHFTYPHFRDVVAEAVERVLDRPGVAAARPVGAST